MKITSLLALSFAATGVAGAAFPQLRIPALQRFDIEPAKDAGSSCVREQRPGTLLNWYTLYAHGVEDIPGTCGKLWDEIDKLGGCKLLSNTFCGKGYVNYNSTTLRWDFTSTLFCHATDLHHVWWETTQNVHGSIECQPPGRHGHDDPYFVGHDVALRADTKAESRCSQQETWVPKPGPRTTIGDDKFFKYEVYAEEIFAEHTSDISGICEALWAQLKFNIFCQEPMMKSCGEVPSQTQGTKALSWKFVVSQSCMADMVESAWQLATKTKFEPIACPGKRSEPATTSRDVALPADTKHEKFCKRWRWGTGATAVFDYYVLATDVESDKISDIPAICNALWDNLKQFPACSTTGSKWCEPAPSPQGTVSVAWWFYVPTSCTNDMVEATWAKATAGKFEPVDCPEKDTGPHGEPGSHKVAIDDESWCVSYYTDGGLVNYDVYGEEIFAEHTSNFRAICDALWGNLTQITQCEPAPSFAGCGEDPDPAPGTRAVGWEFQVPPECTADMVEATWLKATDKRFWPIHCPEAKTSRSVPAVRSHKVVIDCPDRGDL